MASFKARITFTENYTEKDCNDLVKMFYDIDVHGDKPIVDVIFREIYGVQGVSKVAIEYLKKFTDRAKVQIFKLGQEPYYLKNEKQ